MRNPHVIRNQSGQYWLPSESEFIDYAVEPLEAAKDGLGTEPLGLERELARAALHDRTAVAICTDAGPCLPVGFRYWDGRYGMEATVIAATESSIWIERESGVDDETISKGFYDYHLAAGVYSLIGNP